MNVLSMFEERVGAIFGESPSGRATPFSFKKLAKRAVRAMEDETYVINGVDTAPALYTVLVSEDDAQVIRPLYAQVTREAAQLVKSQAERRGYAFVGEPLFRFIPDPTLRSGKFSVFAENVGARTLMRLSEEESEFMGGAPAAAGRRFAGRPSSRPAPQPAPRPACTHLAEDELGLERMPDDLGLPVAAPGAPQVPPLGAAPVAAGAMAGRAARASVPEPAAEPARRPAAEAASCLLIDRSTGRTYAGSAPRTVIGRVRTERGIVLHDPNVSRRHAELTFDGRDWRITDLNSTNGTLVNDVDVDSCLLRDGDLITVGLANLEFREA